MASQNPKQNNHGPPESAVPYPVQGPAYPAQGPAYPAQGPAYPAQGPAYPAQGPAYPAQGPAYPAQGPAYPAQGPPTEQPPAYRTQGCVPNPGMAYPPGTAVGPPQGVPIGYQGQQFVQLPTVTVVHQPLRSPNPVNINCPNCHENVLTKTNKRPGASAWGAVGIIFITGFFFLVPWLFCWIPLCIPSCQDTHHTCPHCKAHLYTHSAL